MAACPTIMPARGTAASRAMARSSSRVSVPNAKALLWPVVVARVATLARQADQGGEEGKAASGEKNFLPPHSRCGTGAGWLLGLWIAFIYGVIIFVTESV